MKSLKETGKKYFEILKERSRKSRVYQPHQLTGLMLAEILEDQKHKSLYMKLAKKHDNQNLLQLAKTISERKNIKNKGAYFMRLLQELKIKNKQK